MKLLLSLMLMSATSFAQTSIVAARVNQIRYSNQFPSLTIAQLDAGTNGALFIAPAEASSQHIANTGNIGIVDWRQGIRMYKAVDFTNSTSLDGWGDSVTAGLSATACNGVQDDTCYLSLIGYAKLQQVTNHGVPGSGIADAGEADVLFAKTITPTFNSTLLTGINDMRNIGTDAAQGLVYLRALMAWLVYAATPTSKLVTGQSGSSQLAYMGSWSNNSQYGGTLGKQTTTQNDQVTITGLCGTTVYIAGIVQVANTATENIVIDGVDKGTYSLTSTLTTIQGRTFQQALFRFPNLKEKCHTAIVKKTDAGISPMYFLWASANGGIYSNTGPFVTVGNCLPILFAPNGSADAVADINALIRQAVTDLSTGDGLQVNLVDVASGFDTSTMVDGATGHPNNAGHAYIANSFLAELNGLQSWRDRSAAKAGGLGGTFERYRGDIYFGLVEPGGAYHYLDNSGADAALVIGSVQAGSSIAAPSLTIGSGTPVAKIAAFAATLTPSSVAANTCAEQTFTITGLTTSDIVNTNGPSPTVGTGIGNQRVSSADTLALTFCNNTAVPLTPASGTYQITAMRF